MSIETAYYRSPIGILEIRVADDTITHILFANSWKGTAMDETQISFAAPIATVIKMCISQLSEYFSGERTTFTFPIKHEGTAFQQMVWAELKNIPYGRTISYLELSKRIGNTKAIRAVGTANGNNCINIVTPCHRVIGSNGDLIGYGGDLWRKKWLLDHENKFANGLQTLF
jgi:methylated-DNA-[protein]-cysteine S-methyltransferase